MTLEAEGYSGRLGFDEFETYFRYGRGNWGNISIVNGTDYVENRA